MSEAFSYKDENGNSVFPGWQVIALMEKYAKLACEAQKVACAATAKIRCTWDNVVDVDFEFYKNDDGQWETYNVDKDSIINTPNVMGL